MIYDIVEFSQHPVSMFKLTMFIDSSLLGIFGLEPIATSSAVVESSGSPNSKSSTAPRIETENLEHEVAVCLNQKI